MLRVRSETAELQNFNGSSREILRLFYAPTMHRARSIRGECRSVRHFSLFEELISVPFSWGRLYDKSGIAATPMSASIPNQGFTQHPWRAARIDDREKQRRLLMPFVIHEVRKLPAAIAPKPMWARGVVDNAREHSFHTCHHLGLESVGQGAPNALIMPDCRLEAGFELRVVSRPHSDSPKTSSVVRPLT